MFEALNLKQIAKEPIHIPKQRIASNSVVNFFARKLISEPLERKIGLNPDVKVTHFAYFTEGSNRFQPDNYTQAMLFHADSDRAVIILPQRSRGYEFAQLTAHYLASNGINGIVFSPPLRGSRLPHDIKDIKELPLVPAEIISLLNQTVGEVKGLASHFYEQFPYMGVCGFSQGGFSASLTYGTDTNFKAAATVLSGGNLASILYHSNDGLALKLQEHFRDENITEAELRETLKFVEPCLYTNNKKDGILIINSTNDSAVPSIYGQELADAWDTLEYLEIPGDHKRTVLKQIPSVMEELYEHFKLNLK